MSGTPGDMIEESNRLDQTPDSQANLDDDLWFLARDIWDWQEVHDVVDEKLALLEAAVRLCKRSLVLRPAGHSKRAHSLHNLAKYTYKLAEEVGHDGIVPDLALLEESVCLSREALALRPTGNRHHKSSLYMFFKQIIVYHSYSDGDIRAFQEALECGSQLLELHPPGEQGRARILGDLGELWWQHAEFSESTQDRNMGLDYFRLSLWASGDSALVYQVVLKATLARYLMTASNLLELSSHTATNADPQRPLHYSPPSILDTNLKRTAYAKPLIGYALEAIKLYQEAAESHVLDMAFQVAVLGSLGNALRNLYRFDKNLSHLHNSQKAYQEVLDLLPHYHEDRATWLMFLSVSLSNLFDATENLDFLLEAIDHADIARGLCDTAKNHRRLCLALHNLARLLASKASKCSDSNSMKSAIACLEQAKSIYDANVNIDGDSLLLNNSIMAHCFLTQGLSTFDPRKGIEHLSLALRQRGSSARDILSRVEPALPLLQSLVHTSEGHTYSDCLL
jgi:tetratricopeptide (TPR) repeat protein